MFFCYCGELSRLVQPFVDGVKRRFGGEIRQDPLFSRCFACLTENGRKKMIFFFFSPLAVVVCLPAGKAGKKKYHRRLTAAVVPLTAHSLLPRPPPAVHTVVHARATVFRGAKLACGDAMIGCSPRSSPEIT